MGLRPDHTHCEADLSENSIDPLTSINLYSDWWAAEMFLVS